MSVQSCPHCGTYTFKYGHDRFAQNGDPICPRCDMTPGEHAYRLRILADSDAVFRQEWREFQYQRDAERAASPSKRDNEVACYTTKHDGVVVRWHAVDLSECERPECDERHATILELATFEAPA